MEKVCGCGAVHDSEGWKALEVVGTEFLGEPLDMRLCNACQSTLAIERRPAGELCHEGDPMSGPRGYGYAWAFGQTCDRPRAFEYGQTLCRATDGRYPRRAPETLRSGAA